MHTFQVGNSPVYDWFIQHHPEMQHWLADPAVHKKVRGTETLCASPGQTVGGTSPLFHALAHAFNEHCPLVITPDAVWLTTLTGLTHHIDQDPEGLRHNFVQHDGKQELEVRVVGGMRTASPEVWEFGIRGWP